MLVLWSLTWHCRDFWYSFTSMMSCFKKPTFCDSVGVIIEERPFSTTGGQMTHAGQLERLITLDVLISSGLACDTAGPTRTHFSGTEDGCWGRSTLSVYVYCAGCVSRGFCTTSCCLTERMCLKLKPSGGLQSLEVTRECRGPYLNSWAQPHLKVLVVGFEGGKPISLL